MPRVFLSYSHEEPEHDQWVFDLGGYLRENGVANFPNFLVGPR